MDTWYLMDVRGGVVGPLSQETAVSLLRERPGLFSKVSRDGTSWSLVKQQTQVQALVTQELPSDRRRREEQEAQRVLFDFDRFRELKPHELFGVPEGASRREYRQGFLTIAKRYHPGRLGKDVAPALLKAHIAVYQLLAEVINQVEQRLPDVPQAQPRASGPVLPPQRPLSQPSPIPQRAPPPTTIGGNNGQPLWRLDALNLRNEHNRMHGLFDVTAETAFVFSAHRLMNLKASGGCFFPCMPTLAMGTKLELVFNFRDAAQTVTSRGSVVFENVFSENKQLRGFGVQLESLKPEVKGFMMREVERLSKR